MSMHKVIWLKVGGKRLHLLKLAGAFFVIAAVLMVASASYNVFLTVDKINYVRSLQTVNSLDDAALQQRAYEIQQLFGWTTAGPFLLSFEDVIGILLAPVAGFLFWLGLAVVSLMVYQSGNVILPVEEWEDKVQEHHRELIRKAVAHAKKR
jgi:hypothetical protein